MEGELGFGTHFGDSAQQSLEEVQLSPYGAHVEVHRKLTQSIASGVHCDRDAQGLPAAPAWQILLTQ